MFLVRINILFCIDWRLVGFVLFRGKIEFILYRKVRDFASDDRVIRGTFGSIKTFRLVGLDFTLLFFIYRI